MPKERATKVDVKYNNLPVLICLLLGRIAPFVYVTCTVSVIVITVSSSTSKRCGAGDCYDVRIFTQFLIIITIFQQHQRDRRGGGVCVMIMMTVASPILWKLILKQV